MSQVRLNELAQSKPPAAEPARGAESKADLTLDELLHSIAYTRLPTQFYALLQLAIPLAAELWSIKWYQSAGWAALVSLYGMWALAAKRIDEADAEERIPSWLRIARNVTKGAGISLTAVLGVGAMIKILSFVFHCPGCAG